MKLFSLLFIVFLTIINCFVRANKRSALDPVVLDGKQLPELLQQDFKNFVAFRIDGKSWQQIPIQIDEKHWQQWQVILQQDCRIIGRNASDLVYADSKTYSGPDENPLFDEDDELVFMAGHVGKKWFRKLMKSPPNYVNNVFLTQELSQFHVHFSLLGFGGRRSGSLGSNFIFYSGIYLCFSQQIG